MFLNIIKIQPNMANIQYQSKSIYVTVICQFVNQHSTPIQLSLFILSGTNFVSDEMNIYVNMAHLQHPLIISHVHNHW